MTLRTCCERRAVADDVLDRAAAGEELAPNARNRVQALHPPPPVRSSRRAVCKSKLQGVRIERRSPTSWGQSCTPKHNLGDSYCSDDKWAVAPGPNARGGLDRERIRSRTPAPTRRSGLKPKDRLMIPARPRSHFRTTGWWLRDEIVLAQALPDAVERQGPDHAGRTR